MNRAQGSVQRGRRYNARLGHTALEGTSGGPFRSLPRAIGCAPVAGFPTDFGERWSINTDEGETITMTAKILDGNALAKKLRADFRREAEALAARGAPPGLAVILVGEDPASQV